MCTLRVRVASANFRRGPNLIHPVRFVAQLGRVFTASGLSEPDEANFRWYQVIVAEDDIVFIREDLVEAIDCDDIDTGITDDTLNDISCAFTVAVSGGANVRSGPHLGFAVIHTLAHHATVAVLAQSQPDDLGFIWYQVRLNNGAQGWVREDLGSLGTACTNLPVREVFEGDIHEGDSHTDIGSASHMHDTCRATVFPAFTRVHLRNGPGLAHTIIATATGGTQFNVLAQSQPDIQGFVWYFVQTASVEAWIRSDLVSLVGECDTLPVNAPAELPIPDADNLFTIAAVNGIQTSVHNPPAHKGIDLAFAVGTELRAPAPCKVVTKLICTPCTATQPNHLRQFGSEFGFGFGHALVLRFAVADLPQATQTFLNNMIPPPAFVYPIYAHLSATLANVGDDLNTGDLFGRTGNTGNSTGPHLHLETRIGIISAVPLFMGTWFGMELINPDVMYSH